MGRVGPARPYVTETEVDGSISLYSPSLQQVLVLNETASDVWRLSDGQHSLDEIVSLLAAAYATDELVLRRDVVATIDSFVAHELISPVG